MFVYLVNIGFVMLVMFMYMIVKIFELFMFFK